MIPLTGKKIATFRERLIELIESSPKSRTDIAAEFGVAKQTLSAWVTGQNSPRLPVVSALADYFGVSLPWLNGFDVPKFPEEKDPDDPLSALPLHLEPIEHLLLDSFRSLSFRGQQLLLDRADELKILYGKENKSNDD